MTGPVRLPLAAAQNFQKTLPEEARARVDEAIKHAKDGMVTIDPGSVPEANQAKLQELGEQWSGASKFESGQPSSGLGDSKLGAPGLSSQLSGLKGPLKTELVEWEKLSSRTGFPVGDHKPSLRLDSNTYEVQPGDSLSSIAKRLGIPVATLKLANPQLGRFPENFNHLVARGPNGRGRATVLQIPAQIIEWKAEAMNALDFLKATKDASVGLWAVSTLRHAQSNGVDLKAMGVTDNQLDRWEHDFRTQYAQGILTEIRKGPGDIIALVLIDALRETVKQGLDLRTLGIDETQLAAWENQAKIAVAKSDLAELRKGVADPYLGRGMVKSVREAAAAGIDLGVDAAQLNAWDEAFKQN